MSKNLLSIVFFTFFIFNFAQQRVEYDEVKITADNQAKNLIKKVLQEQKKNAPEAQSNFQYSSYFKMLITSNRDSILKDRLYTPEKKENPAKKGKGLEIGLENIEMIDVLKRGHIFIAERAIDHYYSKEYGKKNIIQANRFSGVKSPVYETAALEAQSFDLSQPEFVFLGNKFVNPISNQGITEYRYKIIDTTFINQRSAINVAFKPIGDSIEGHLRGNVWIDKATLGVMKFDVDQAKTKKHNEIIGEYELIEGSWFPSLLHFKINAGRYDYVSEKITETEHEIHLDTIKKSQPILLLGVTHFNNRKVNTPIDKKIFRGYESEVMPQAFSLTPEQMQTYRQGYELDSIEYNTYQYIDSLGKAAKVDKWIRLGRAAMTGSAKIGRVDLDLTSIYNYNPYEGNRLGARFKTNYDFDDRWGLEGYFAYGFKDHRWKYGGGVSYLVNKPYFGIIGVRYFDDISNFASPTYSFENNYRNFRENLDRFNNDLFTKERNGTLYYQQDFWKTFSGKISLSRNQKEAVFGYQYLGENVFDFFDIALGVKWSPNDNYTRTEFGKVVLDQNSPVFQANVTQGIKALGGEYQYTRLDFKAQHQWNNPIGNLDILLRSGWAWGDLPLTNAYVGNGNTYLETGVFNNFTVAGENSFETMGIGEFYSDKYASFQVKQNIKGIKIFKKDLDINWLYRSLIGDMNQPEKHSFAIKSPSDYFQETGVELHNVFSIFGLGAYYRFGSYHLEHESQNFAVKMTVKIKF